MIQLANVELREIRLNLVEPFQTSTGLTETKRILLLELTTTDGLSTWSECVAESHPGYSPDTVDTCWFALSQWVIPAVLGRNVDSPAATHTLIANNIRGHKMARATVEMGMWALWALRDEVSLAALLVRESQHCRAESITPKNKVEAGVALGMQSDPNALAARVNTVASEGYRRIRIKISPERDVAFIRAAREAAGAALSLAADANGSYSLENSGHVSALEEIDTLGLAMLEQPLAHDDLVGHAALQRKLLTPICLDETIDGDSAAASMLALGSGRVINLKPGRVGGFNQAIAIHDRCARTGVPVWCGGMLESGIGRAYNVALASLPNFSQPGDLSPSSRYWERDIITSPWTMDAAGLVKVPLERPGIGVDVNVGYIDDLTVRRANFSAD